MFIPATISQLPDPDKVTVIELHQNVDALGLCILSKGQYAAAYGANAIDLALPNPQELDYCFRNSILLFFWLRLQSAPNRACSRRSRSRRGRTAQTCRSTFLLSNVPATKAH